MKKATKKEIQSIKDFFVDNYKDAVTELNFNNDYELLIAIMLSAQCTDKRVNLITPALFKQYPTLKEISLADVDSIKELIKSCSFFNNKAKNISNMAKSVIKDYNGKIPSLKDDLISLAGVGNKTANVFLIEYYKANLMAVDTHVFRVSHRLGLSKAKNVKQTEEDLTKTFKDNLAILHQGMVLFGRYICKAVKPKCNICKLQKQCKYQLK